MQGKETSLSKWEADYPELDWWGLRRLLWALNRAIPGLWLDGSAYLAGGAIVRALAGEPMKDLDVWVHPETLKSYVLALTRDSWSLQPDLRGRDYAPMHRKVMEKEEEGQSWTMDLIAYNFGPPAEVCDRFDFRAAALATDGRDLWAMGGALEDILARQLTPLRRTRLGRVQKYEERGWTLVGALADVVLPERAPWEQLMGAEPVEVGGG